MTTMSEAAARAATTPLRTVTLGPAAFADAWSDKPRGPVTIGLRFLSEQDIQAARAEAAKQAVGWYLDKNDSGCIDEDARADAFEDALLRWAVARGTCSPVDVRQPYFEAAEDTVRTALTSDGVRRIWDELVILHKGSGVGIEPATDNDLRLLCRIVTAGDALPGLAPGPAAEVRKLLAYCLHQLAPYAGDVDDDAEDEPEDVAVYTTTR